MQAFDILDTELKKMFVFFLEEICRIIFQERH